MVTEQEVVVDFGTERTVAGGPLMDFRISVAPELALTPGEIGRRIVRHGLADVLEWLGEEVGPDQNEEQMLVFDDIICLSPRMAQLVRDTYGEKTVDRDVVTEYANHFEVRATP